MSIPVQLRHNKTIFSSRTDAITKMTAYLTAHPEQFLDGEIITVRYYNNDTVVSANATIKKDDTNISLSLSVEEQDTIRIQESETEPTDTDLLWLTDEEDTSDIQADIRSLKATVKNIITVLNKHVHAFEHALNSGDIYNSAKDEMMAGEEPEFPDYDESGETINDSGSTVLATDFEVYIANTPLSSYTADNTSISLYKTETYHLRPVYKESGATQTLNPVTYSSSSSNIVINGNKMRALAAGNATITAVMTNEVSSVTKNYTIYFNLNEEPDYCDYAEPNVKHILLKSVATYDELVNNASYLCNNELIWCEESNGLYLRAKTSLGTIQLMKINGSGSIIIDPDDPDTGSTKFVVDEDTNYLTITSDNNKVTINDDVLTFNTGKIDENNILILNNS